MSIERPRDPIVGSGRQGEPREFPLKGWIWAAFTAHAVNTLAIDEPCCPHECEPCAALAVLHEDGGIEHALAPYVVKSGGDWDWWNPDPASGPDIPGLGRVGSFRWDWVTDRWCTPETCEAGDVDA